MTQFEVKIAGRDEYPSHIRLLLVGQPGVGKTRLAASFPNPIFANSSGGLTTLSQIGKVPYVTVESERDLYELKLALERSAEEREELFGRPVDTLVIDSIDEFQRFVMASRLKQMGRQDTLPEDWGWIATRLNKILAGLCQLELDIVIISRTKDVSMGSDLTVVKPNLGGSFCEGIHRYVHSSLWMRAHTELELEFDAPEATEPGVHRQLLASPHRAAEWCHDKTGQLPITMIADDPDYVVADIRERILGARDEVISDSQVFTVDLNDEDAVKEPIEGAEPGTGQLNEAETTYVCHNCNSECSEEIWQNLSKTRFGKPLCRDCFKEKDK